MNLIKFLLASILLALPTGLFAQTPDEALTGAEAECIPAEYLALHPDVAANSYWATRPLEHWNAYGKGQGRAPNFEVAGFQPGAYLERYPDLRAAFGENEIAAFNHYVTYGISEGRKGCGNFTPEEYLELNPALKATYGTDYVGAFRHWVRSGHQSGMIASFAQAGLDVEEYATLNPDLGLVKNEWGELSGAGRVQGWQHYWNHGVREGRKFDAEFQPADYVALYPDLEAAYGWNPTALSKHWMDSGRHEGRIGILPASGLYFLRSASSDLVFTVHNWQTTAGTPLIQYYDGSDAIQMWKFERLGGNTYKITATYNNLKLSVPKGASGSVSVTLEADRGDYDPSQVWMLWPNDDGSFLLENLESSLVIDVPGANPNPDSLITWWKSGADNQRWTLEAVSEESLEDQDPRKIAPITIGPVKIASDSVRTLGFTVNNWSASPGTALIQYPISNASIQYWTLERWGPFFKIRSTHGLKAGVSNPSTANSGITLQSESGWWASSQKWLLWPTGDGSVVLQNAATGRFLESNGLGSNYYQLRDSTGAGNQVWWMSK